MHQVTSPHRPSRTDRDLAKQAKPGHGVPSQDPDPAAQFPMGRDLAVREKKTVFVSAGVMTGAALGAVLGTVLVGPVGSVGGGMLGAVAGAFGGRIVGAAVVHYSV